MGLGEPTDPEKQLLVEKLLSNTDLQNDGQDGTDAACFLGNGQEDDSFHAQNAKRKQLVLQEIAKPDFRQSVVMVDFIIRPIDGMINRLFKRNARLSKMTLLGNKYSGWDEDSKKSRELFLDVVSGRFGWACVEEYCHLVKTGMDPMTRMGVGPENIKVLFTLALHLISDIWRRFVHDFSDKQFQIFHLAELEGDAFCAHRQALFSSLESCQMCFDPCFSRILDDQCFSQDDASLILHDVCTFSPLSSEPVEIKNGQVQSVTSRRGNQAVKGPVASRESSFLLSCIRDFELVRHFVEEQTLPKPTTTSGILRRVGKTGSNQHSKSKEPWFKIMYKWGRVHGLDQTRNYILFKTSLTYFIYMLIHYLSI